MEVPADLDFFTILVDFGGQVGRENRSKIDQKSIPKGIRKMIEKKGPLGSVLEASWDPKIHGIRCTRPESAGRDRGGGYAEAPP